MSICVLLRRKRGSSRCGLLTRRMSRLASSSRDSSFEAIRSRVAEVPRTRRVGCEFGPGGRPEARPSRRRRCRRSAGWSRFVCRIVATQNMALLGRSLRRRRCFCRGSRLTQLRELCFFWNAALPVLRVISTSGSTAWRQTRCESGPPSLHSVRRWARSV